MFDPSIALSAGSQNSVPMIWRCAGKKKSEQARPKGRIAGKDQPRQPYSDLCVLPDGRVLVGYRGRYINSDFGLQIRSADDLAVASELPDAGGRLCLRDDGKVLASGPLYEGYESSTRIVDLPALSVSETFPVCVPYLWLNDRAGRFVGQTPSYPDFASEPYVDPALLERHPSFRPLVAGERKHRLLVVGPKGNAEDVLEAAEIGPEYPVFRRLALSPDAATLYAATEVSVGAVSTSDWSVQWKVRLGDPSGAKLYAAYALALSEDGRQLAVGGLAGHRNLANAVAVLDANNGKMTAMGKSAGRALGSTSVRSLAWHPSGWLAAAAASGFVAHIDPLGHVRTWKAAGKAVETLTFINGGRSLLVGGTEKHFRVWPLLEDEATESTG